MMTAYEGRAPFEILAGLTPAQTERILGIGTKMTVPSGSLLAPLGGQADRIFLVGAGRVALSLPLNVRGEEKDVFLEEVGPGETVGWSAMVPPHRFTLCARATVDAEVTALPRAALEELFGADREIGMTILRNLAEMVGQRLQKVQAMWVREIQRAVDARFGR